jgi:hypothetical protein
VLPGARAVRPASAGSSFFGIAGDAHPIGHQAAGLEKLTEFWFRSASWHSDCNPLPFFFELLFFFSELLFLLPQPAFRTLQLARIVVPTPGIRILSLVDSKIRGL